MFYVFDLSVWPKILSNLCAIFSHIFLFGVDVETTFMTFHCQNTQNRRTPWNFIYYLSPGMEYSHSFCFILITNSVITSHTERDTDREKEKENRKKKKKEML